MIQFKTIRVGIGWDGNEIFMEGDTIIFQEMEEIIQLVKEPELGKEPEIEKFKTGDFQTILGIFLYDGREIVYEDEWTKSRDLDARWKIGKISSNMMLQIIDNFIE